MTMDKASKEKVGRKEAQVARRTEREQPRESMNLPEPLDEKSLDEVMRDSPL